MVVGDHSSNSKEPNEQTVNLKRIITHENYDGGTLENDIALFELESPVSWTRDIKPVCLPSIDPAPNELCITTGWGDTRGNLSIIHQWSNYQSSSYMYIIDRRQPTGMRRVD